MHTVIDSVLCLVLLGVAAVGSLICLMEIEAVSTGLNPGPWWASLITLVVAPLVGIVLCASRMVRRG